MNYDRDPLTNVNLFRLTTFVDSVYEMRELGNRDWQWPPLTNPVNVLDWNNFCLSYSVSKRQMKMIHNGVVEVDHVRPVEVEGVEDYLPSEWFSPMTDGIKTHNLTMKGTIVLMKDPTVSAMGSFTDFNVWDVELSSEEMINFTLCRGQVEGSLLPWNSEDWTFTEDIGEDEFSVETVEYKDLCWSKERLTVFPDRLTVQAGFELCQVLGGDLVVTKQEEDYEEVMTSHLTPQHPHRISYSFTSH